MTSTSYQPLDLSKSKEKYRSSREAAEEMAVSRAMYESFMLHHRPRSHSSVFSSMEHKSKHGGAKKDRDCSLSWSSTFGTAIPTTTIPGNLLPLHHRSGFVYVPPPPGVFQDKSPQPIENGIPPPHPVPSKLFPRYGIPSASIIDSDNRHTAMSGGSRKVSASSPGCCCCSNAHSAPERRITDYFTPAFTFRNNYGIDSLNAITPLRRDYLGQTTGAASKALYPHTVEPFYEHSRDLQSMYCRPKDVCELWKYEGERVGFLPTNGRQFKHADDKRQSPKRVASIDGSDDEDIKRLRFCENTKADERRIGETLKEEICDTSNNYQSIDQKIWKKEEASTMMSEEHSVHEDLEKDAEVDSSVPTNRPLRLKSKDSIGPGYIEMIAKAILNSSSKRCMLTDIYKYISTTYSRYKDDTVCWRNIVRHHLSHYECFVKAEHNGHAHYWTINPDMEQDFINGKFHRKRRPNRRKRTIPSTKIIASNNSSATLGSVTSPIANWFPSTFHPYYRDELAKPYVFVHGGQPWDQLRGCYPYLLDSNTSRHPLDKSYR